MEKFNFSPVKGDFKNEVEKCICVPILNSKGINVDDIFSLQDILEKKYPDLTFTNRWSTYKRDGKEGYMFFYQ